MHFETLDSRSAYVLIICIIFCIFYKYIIYMHIYVTLIIGIFNNAQYNKIQFTIDLQTYISYDSHSNFVREAKT